MTSGVQPPSSGAPVPVAGVTGGPPVLGGQISNDPNTGNVVIAPNPGQVLQVRKGNNPTALQVYEYFHTNTDYSRIALNSQTNGPFSLAVETAPSTVIRALQLNANGNLLIATANVTLTPTLLTVPNLTATGNINAVGAGFSGNVSAANLTFASAGGVLGWPGGGQLTTDTNFLYLIPPTGGSILFTTIVRFNNAFTTTATAGAATALPATPALYITVLDAGGSQRKIPAYNP